MDRRIRFAVSLLLLVTNLVHGSGQTQEDVALPEVSTTSSEISVTKATRFVRVGPGEQLPDSMEEYHGKQSNKDERKSREEVEEEYEGEDDDEYEEELKAVAESHEAMSKDERRNSNVSSINETRPGMTSERLPAVKSFDSHEVTVTNFSDEDTASNEAITAEDLDKNDQEECELLKFKKGKNPKLCRTDKEKMKRVPTVKKELSTQKEILIASNETQLPESSKSLAPSQETVNRLDETTKPLRRRRADQTLLLGKLNQRKRDSLDELATMELDKSTIMRLKVFAARRLAEVTKGKEEFRERGLDVPVSLDNLENALLKLIDVAGKAERHFNMLESLQKILGSLEEESASAESSGRNTEGKQREKVSGQEATTISPEPATAPSPTTKSEPLSEYDVPAPYQRPRYNQPPFQEFPHHRLDEDYQDDYAPEPSSFVQSQDYRQPSSREFGMSRGWPELPYMYGRAWNPNERRVPPWYWRPPVYPEFKYWPRERFPPAERNYWSNLSEEDEIEDEIAAERMWRQRQQERYPWTRSRSSSWSMEKPLKPASWQHADRPAKTQDREEFSTSREKSKNRSEHEKAAAKPDLKGKPVLPQITMKTWNSLTSDPATWPYKLPGAKPWPKDENGKSYNPNADLVKKLGLDKQDSVWPKATSNPADTSPGKKTKNETSKDISTKYKPDWEKSELSDYKTKSRSTKPGKSRARTHHEGKNKEEWRKSQEGESPQNDQASSWPRKYESAENWPNKESLPKIQSVGAWVMPADQSTWKPYQIKSIQSLDDNSSSRKWASSSGISRAGSAERKWPAKGATRWTEKMKDGGQWLDESHAVGSWPEKSNGGGTWPAKATKSSSWYTKAKEPNSGWSSQGSTANLWGSNVKENSSWRTKPNDWYSKITDNNSWSVKPNPVSWTNKSNESDVWTAKTNPSKFNNAGSWSAKMSREDTWPRKSSETSSWPSKMNELGSWPPKVSDAWNYGKSSTGTWPSKWKQFAYHRVTAMPISKPGTTADASASKPKNAFVAVSAVSSPKYGAGSEWRKNEEEVRENAASSGGQSQVSLESPIYAWKKEGTSSAVRGLGTDPLENQLEALRQIDFWPYKESEAEKEFTSTTERPTSATASPGASNSTTQTISKQQEASKESSEPLATDERAIPVK